MRGLSVDTDTLYAGICVSNHISHFSVEDLRSVDLTPLNSTYLTEDTTLLDLKLAPSLFIVLFRECTYLVQSFSRDGNLSHLIVPQEQLNEARFFCLDRHLNIIVSDFETHNVKVFNRDGQLVTTIGHEGIEPGEFESPQGIDISKTGVIVVVDLKDSHKIQIFKNYFIIFYYLLFFTLILFVFTLGVKRMSRIFGYSFVSNKYSLPSNISIMHKSRRVRMKIFVVISVSNENEIISVRFIFGTNIRIFGIFVSNLS